jgi:hypothetical protein
MKTKQARQPTAETAMDITIRKEEGEGTGEEAGLLLNVSRS